MLRRMNSPGKWCTVFYELQSQLGDSISVKPVPSFCLMAMGGPHTVYHRFREKPDRPERMRNWRKGRVSGPAIHSEMK